MNNDLISREALKDFAYINKGNFNTVEGIREWIDNAPTVELFCSYLSDGEVRQPCVEGPCEQDRPQGEWIKIGDIGLAYTCNKCDEVSVIPTNFCPNCGAYMRKGGEDNE